MKIQIKSRYDDSVIFEGEFENLRQAVETAVKNKVSLYGANLRGAYLRGANLSGADLGGADLGGANLGNANLSRADLSWAYLDGADLTGANLYGSNLGNANLSGANLSVAQLRGADLRFNPHVFGLYMGKDFCFGWKRGKEIIIKIGCVELPAKQWKKDFKKIGQQYGYAPKETARYGRTIKFLEAELKSRK